MATIIEQKRLSQTIRLVKKISYRRKGPMVTIGKLLPKKTGAGA
jgi:hypothetical protein